VILEIFDILDKKVLLTAPTGKAAQRLKELSDKDVDSKTIHLALIQHKTFDKYDAVIVDESSMMDLEIMYRLIKKIGDNTRLILIGDPNQLPPIGFGKPFEDLVESKLFPTTMLYKIFRQDLEDIVLLSNAALNDPREFLKRLSKGVGKGINYVGITDPDKYDIVIRDLYLAFAQKYGLEYTRDNVIVLSPTMYKYNPSVFNVNKQIALALNKNRKITGNNIEFVTGDKIINTENDYIREIMNGETGFIGKRRTLDELYIKFKDFQLFKDWELSDFQLAYAITVHKSQGSEFDYIIIPLHPNHINIWDTKMLYTAITRAKRGVLFVGPDLKVYPPQELFKIISTVPAKGSNSFMDYLKIYNKGVDFNDRQLITNS
jgi:exodeoxyribonuclease V alpha subunit